MLRLQHIRDNFEARVSRKAGVRFLKGIETFLNYDSRLMPRCSLYSLFLSKYKRKKTINKITRHKRAGDYVRVMKVWKSYFAAFMVTSIIFFMASSVFF